MPRKKVIRIKISPQTNVRATQGDKIFFQIPEGDLRPEGLKRKRRLQKYNQYKKDLRLAAESINYRLADHGTHITFFIPVPKSWSKAKKARHHLEPHLPKPDWDNFAKAFQDALRASDSSVWDCRVTKRWVNAETGYIEIFPPQ